MALAADAVPKYNNKTTSVSNYSHLIQIPDEIILILILVETKYCVVKIVVPTYRVLDKHVPTNNKSDKFSDGHITVNIRRSSFGYSAGEFSVTNS